MSVTAYQLRQIYGLSSDDSLNWEMPLNYAMGLFHILDNQNRMIDFLAQIGWESNNLTELEENLNYSEQGLRKYFKKYFKENEFAFYAHRPEWIGNIVYANRMGNGNNQSGDGYKYRGRGLIQLTGKNNYQEFDKACGFDTVTFPNILKQPIFATISAAWYWSTHGCNELADKNDFEQETKVINGGLNGYDGRLKLREHIKTIIGK